MARKKEEDLKSIVEAGIKAVLEEKDKEPSDGRLKALALGIKMCALNAKLIEDQYGDFFKPGDAGSVSEQPHGEKSVPRKRANGSGEPDIDA